MLLNLLKLKIRCLLIKTKTSEARKIIEKIENNATNLNNLAVYLYDFIDDYSPFGKIAAQFSSIFADHKSSNKNPYNLLWAARDQVMHIYRERFITPEMTNKQDQQTTQTKQQTKK